MCLYKGLIQPLTQKQLIKCKNIHITGASTNPKKVKEAINEMQVAKDIQYATSHINI